MAKKEDKEATGFQGISYGMMDGVINSIGVLSGLSVTGQPLIILLGILAAALANSFANAGGIHVSLETDKKHPKEVWKSTIYCFFVTLGVMLLITIPVIFLPIKIGIIMAIALGMMILISLGLFVRKVRNEKSFNLVLEYAALGIVVAIVCFAAGELFKIIVGTALNI